MSCLVIIPYRDRAAHLKCLVPRLKEFLPDAGILVVEQAKGKPFNRAKLLNIGFLEGGGWQEYIIDHDVDMIPVKGKVDYSIPAGGVCHIAGRASQFHYVMPFKEYFGGVVAFRSDAFRYIGGYSNNFWGWGGEDNEMHDHVIKNNFEIEFRPCVFESLHHDRVIDGRMHRNNVQLWQKGRWPGDGLSSCVYRVIERRDMKGYELLRVFV